MRGNWVQIHDGQLFNLNAYYKIECFKVECTSKPEWRIVLRHPDEAWDEKFFYDDEPTWQGDVLKIKSALSLPE